ncbi:MAG: cobyric acid synthase [Lachnospiraceae bacterium]
MAKVIMIQGTMSNVGKSLITAGLCRILKQDGYKVAPFKSQNMALNSHITKEGLEIGRAQAVQAEAAGLEPEPDMNPILLKPSSDTGAQVIVNGKVLGNMPATEYFRYKKKLIPEIMGAFKRLSEKYDIIVVEGAGSPAEINLKQDDIVNMGLAKMLNAPVLLVGDIDRGGVFAQLAGTIMLLNEEEKNRIQGIIVNKFRGDKTILEPGLKMLEDITKKSVVGVIPYMDVDIEEEDSLSAHLEQKLVNGLVDVAVIRLPRISNFTDFDVLSAVDGISVRYISHAYEFGRPDVVILPGTKNTIGDLLWMRQNGIESLIKKAAASETIVVGICGGFQMLGTRLEDPYGVEEDWMQNKSIEAGAINGIGLLPVKTVFAREKIRTQVTGKVRDIGGKLSGLSGSTVEGYEIHMGLTFVDYDNQYLMDEGSGYFCSVQETQEVKSKGQNVMIKADGYWCRNVYGTYLHGIFDSKDMIKNLSSLLLKEKGVDDNIEKEWDRATYREEQYNRLASGIRKNIDMDLIYSVLNLLK